jgi:ribonuclease P protein component
MKKLKRLNRKEFKEVLKKGKTAKISYLILKYSEHDLPFFRLGVLITKKVSKKATERNKIKRRIREIVRSNLPETAKKLDMVFIVVPGIKNDFQLLKEKVIKIFEKIKNVE